MTFYTASELLGEKNYEDIALGFSCADLIAFWESLWDSFIENDVQ